MGDVFDRDWPPLNLSNSGLTVAQKCWRQYFWKTYWTWQAWPRAKKRKVESRRRAYALKSAVNMYTLPGQVVHKHAARFARASATGRDWPGQEAAVKAAVEDLEKAVSDASTRTERTATKQRPMLLEDYYDKTVEHARARKTVTDSINALYADQYLDQLAELGEEALINCEEPVQWDVALRGGGTGTVWLVPDLAFRQVVIDPIGKFEEIVVIDWKTGKQRDEHDDQLDLYAAWAFGLPKYKGLQRRVLAVAVYLTHDQVRERMPTVQEADSALLRLTGWLPKELRKRVVGGDLERNEPLLGGEAGKKAWRKLPEGSRECGWCDYRRLCKRG